MNCTQCGAFINEDKRFCTQCGARVESGREVSPYEMTDEISNKQQVKVQKVIVGQEERYEVRGDSRQSEVKEEMWFGNSRGIVGFAELLVTLLAHPMTTGQALYSHFDKKVSCIYVAILITLSSCITYLSFQSISNKIANLFIRSVYKIFFRFSSCKRVFIEVIEKGNSQGLNSDTNEVRPF